MTTTHHLYLCDKVTGKCDMVKKPDKSLNLIKHTLLKLLPHIYFSFIRQKFWIPILKNSFNLSKDFTKHICDKYLFQPFKNIYADRHIMICVCLYVCFKRVEQNN